MLKKNMMCRKPKISIITATYNSAATLEQTIASVAKQTYSNIEYIVVDGGSTDGTVEILKKNEESISYYISEPDAGIYDAFNKGVQLATGDYIQFLGSDDSLCEIETVERVVQSIDETVDILSAPIWMVDGKLGMQRLVTNKHAAGKSCFDGRMIPHPGMFVRREILLRYPFDTQYRIAADYLFFLTCYFNELIRFKFIDLPVVFFSVDGVSTNSLEVLVKENNTIRKQFGYPIEILPKKSAFKDVIKHCMKVLHVFDIFRYAFYRFIKGTWQPHHCSWRLCRWCK